MRLFKPGWMSDNLNRAFASLQSITSEEELLNVVKNAPMQEIRLRAVKKLRSKDVLLQLAGRSSGVPEAVSACAAECYASLLSFPKDENRIIDTLLKNRALGKTAKAARKAAARLLPQDHALLDEPCCPECGCIGSVLDYHRISHTPIGYDGFRCLACGKCEEANHHDIALRGFRKPQDFSVPLRAFSSRS